MYFPVGWPKDLKILLDSTEARLKGSLSISANREKDLLALTFEDCIILLSAKPSVLLLKINISEDHQDVFGQLMFSFWRGDSSAIVTATSSGFLVFHSLKKEEEGCLEQFDPQSPNLSRESAELYPRELPSKYTSEQVTYVQVPGHILSVSCLRDELLVSNTQGQVLRFFWNGTLNEAFCFDLEEVPFAVDQLTARAFLPSKPTMSVTSLEYSPLIGGYALVFNTGRCAFLTSVSAFYHPKELVCLWAPRDDATCTSVNHRYRLIAFGTKISQCFIYSIDESTGGLQLSHSTVLSSRDYPGCPGEVSCIRWSPDGSVIAVAWSKFGLSVWSTFGSLLFSSLAWEAGPDCHQANFNFLVDSMEWAVDGYQLWFSDKKTKEEADGSQVTTETSVYQMAFVKSPYTYNSCTSVEKTLYLQGDDRIYLSGPDITRSRKDFRPVSPGSTKGPNPGSSFLDNKLWINIQVPHSYMGSNWPIRYCSVDESNELIAVAGRAGIAYYNCATRRWKLYSNETQERDFVATTCPIWYKSEYLLLGCYDLSKDRDEIRIYSRNSPRLDNYFMKCAPLQCQILLMNAYKDRLIVYTVDSRISIFKIESGSGSSGINIDLVIYETIDLSGWGFHPACMISLSLSSLTAEFQRFSTSYEDELLLERGRVTPEYSEDSVYSILINICGRVLLLQARRDVDGSTYQEEQEQDEGMPCYSTPIVLASCVETVWTPEPAKLSYSGGRSHLTHALWLCCGTQGMRVWIPLFTRPGTNVHMYTAKRIMLNFQLQVYPLAVLCEEAVLVGVESDSTVFSSECGWPASLPYCIFERTTQVYLHHIFRQLIRRNLGFHAWEIARGCMDLPYFSHSLELLLHEVLEEEATSKEPIPDPLLPSVIEFIQEFPVYLKTISQCARKTEVALWPYLFNATANPRNLFQKCLENRHLNTAASYLIILQNLEPSSVSRHYATQLLDAALELGRWDLAKDLVRFLRAIDPNDVETPKPTVQTSFTIPPYGGAYGLNYAPSPMASNGDEMVLHAKVHSRQRNMTGTTNKQTSPPVALASTGKILRREVIRSTSDAKLGSTAEPLADPRGAIARKFSAPAQPSGGNSSDAFSGGCAEDVYLDVILQRHARHLLASGRVYEMALLSAHLDIPMDKWLKREANRAAVVEDFSKALRRIHADFQWPYPESLFSKNAPHHDKDITDLSPTDLRIGGEVTEGQDFMGPEPAVSSEEARLTARAFSSIDTGIGERSTGYGGSEADIPDSNSDILSDSMFSQLSFADEIKVSRSITLPPEDVERQLRFILDIFCEADCFDWALVLAISLRDIPMVLHVIGQSFRKSANNDVPLRLRCGLFSLRLWVDQHCSGYRPVLAAATNHILVCLKSVPALDELQPVLEPSLAPLPSVEPLMTSSYKETVESQLTKSVSEMVLVPNGEINRPVDPETKSLMEDNGSRCVIQ